MIFCSIHLSLLFSLSILMIVLGGILTYFLASPKKRNFKDKKVIFYFLLFSFLILINVSLYMFNLLEIRLFMGVEDFVGFFNFILLSFHFFIFVRFFDLLDTTLMGLSLVFGFSISLFVLLELFEFGSVVIYQLPFLLGFLIVFPLVIIKFLINEKK